MRVPDLMQTDVETIPVEGLVNDGFIALAESGVSALPVVDSAGRLVGVISKTDIPASEEDAAAEAARDSMLEEQPEGRLCEPIEASARSSGVKGSSRSRSSGGSVHA